MFASDMQRLIATHARSIGQWVNPTTAEGLRLVARWWWWESKSSKSGDALLYAKTLYAKSKALAA